MENIKLSCSNIVTSYQTMFDQFEKISDENVRLKTENIQLVQNEKDLMSVSFIVSTKNENASLLRKIDLLEKSNTILRTTIQSLKTTMNEPKYSQTSSDIKDDLSVSLQHHDSNSSTSDTDTVDDAEESESLYTITYRKKSYYLDKNDQLYDIGPDGEKLETIGRRKFDTKKEKYKYVLF